MSIAVSSTEESHRQSLKSKRFYADQEIAIVCRQYHWQKIGHIEIAKVIEITPSGKLVVYIKGRGDYVFDPDGSRCPTLHGTYEYAALEHLSDELRDEVERRELIKQIDIHWNHYNKYLATAELRQVTATLRRAEERHEDHSR